MWTKSKSVMLSSILVKIVFICLAVGAFFIPEFVEWYSCFSLRPKVLIPLCVTLYATLIPAFIAIISLNNLIRNINKETIFIAENVKLLRILSWCCFAASLIYGILGFFILLSFIICFAAAFFGLILRVIKNVFEQAIEIREENDFTI